jgi:cytochrome c553
MKPLLLCLGFLTLLGMAGLTRAAGDVQAGKAKSSSCAMCHGANGEGKGANPKLAGVAQGQFVQAMEDFKSGKRKDPTMKTYADSLSAADIANLAAYYASLGGK